MKICLLALALLPATATRPAPAGTGTSITFHPEAGSSLTKTFRMTMTGDLEAFTMVMGGQESSPEMEMEFENTQVISITDEYVAVDEGRPTELLRTFETLESTESQTGSMMEDEETETSSPLEGETVSFEWDEEEEEYEVSFVDSNADEDLLEELEEDMDLRGFLPDGDVEEGDEWEFDAENIEDLLSIGGDLQLEEDDEDAAGEAFEEAFGDSLEGTLTCRFAGTREDDGRTLAVIELEAELEGSGEAEEDSEMGPRSTEVTMELELEGELLWDLSAGHMVSFELGGDLTLEMNMTIGEGHGEMQFLFAGEIDMSAEAE